MRIRRVNLGRGLVVVVEKVVEVEFVNNAVVVANHMIEVKIELVGDRGDLVFKELMILLSGVRSVKEACEAMLIISVIAKIWEMAELAVVEFIQGRCSSD